MGGDAVSGRLIGVGVGPGDPELLTLRAARIIDAAPVVAYPAPEGGESFARAIVADRLGGKREIRIDVPMRTERFPAQDVYDRAAEEIADALGAGHDVVVLCEGDPFFYGSFMYLHDRLRGRYRTEVVPGISSLTTAAAVLEQPLAARNEVLAIVPGPSDDRTVRAALQANQSLVFIKVGRHLARLRSLLAEAGVEDARYVERLSLPNQRVLPLAEVADDAVPYFSMILVYRGTEGWRANRAA